jgi:hypothetical protein
VSVVKAKNAEESKKEEELEEDDRDPKLVGEEELGSIATYEKTVNIRFANFSVLVRAH